MKWTVIILNLLVAIVLIFLGRLAISIHRAHSYSMYREFIAVGAVDEQKLASIPGASGFLYDMPVRLRQIGEAEFWFSYISELAAGACVINAAVIFFLVRRQEARHEA